MALSNWSLLAFGPEGKVCGGTLVNELGSVEIYKNWVYVHSEKMWLPECEFSSPIIAVIDEGKMNIAGFNLEVYRSDRQSAVFLYAKSGNMESSRFMAGIGCSAYAGGEHVGVREHTWIEFQGWLHDREGGWKSGFKVWLKKLSSQTPQSANQGDRYLLANDTAPLTEVGKKPGKTTAMKMVEAIDYSSGE